MKIPRLTIADHFGETPNLADGSESPVEVWRGPGDAVVAYSATIGDRHWVDMPGVARFRFRAKGDEVEACPHAPANLDVVRDAYRRAVLPAVVQARGAEVIHASAVWTPIGVVALAGRSGTGKSTLAVGLGRRGHPLWADDSVVLEMSDGHALAVPLPFRMRLRAEAVAFFASDKNGVAGLDPVEAAHPASGPEPLAAVCVLERVSGLQGGVRVEPLPSSVAFRTLLPHAFCFRLGDRPGKRRMVEHYLQLVECVPCLAIRFEPDLEQLPALLDAIEREVMRSAASAREERAWSSTAC